MSFPPTICAWAEDGLIEVEAEVEVAIITITITVTVAMRQPMRVRCTMFNRHHTVMGGVATPMITLTVLLHTLLGRRHHHINTGKGMHPGHTRRSPRTAGTLTRMAAGEFQHGRCLVRTVGADTVLDPRAEADTVEAIEEDMIAAAAVVTVVEVIVMEIAEEGLTMLHHIRATTIPASTMEDITQGAEAHREDGVEVEATEL